MSEANFQLLDEEIIKNYSNTTVTQLAKKLKVSRGTIQRRAKNLGLSKYKYYSRKPLEIEVCVDHLLPRCVITSYGRIVNRETNIILSPKLSEGYWVISTQVDGKTYYQRVHRLIGYAFIPNPNNLPVLNHLDGDKSNNSITNLEWTTVEGNNYHAYKTGLLPFGEKSSSATITEKQAIEIIEQLNNGRTTAEIVKNLDFATRSITQKIKYKQRWKHLNHLMDW